jgi:hypothetical protein
MWRSARIPARPDQAPALAHHVAKRPQPLIVLPVSELASPRVAHGVGHPVAHDLLAVESPSPAAMVRVAETVPGLPIEKK